MRYGGASLDVPLRLRVEQRPPRMVPSISILVAIVIQPLHNCRIYVYLSKRGPSIQISQRSTTARISHRRTKDARTYIRHTPGSDEPRTQTVLISHRHTPSSYAFKPSIAPASMCSARFNARYTITTHERSTLSEPAHTWQKSKTAAFAPATNELQT